MTKNINLLSLILWVLIPLNSFSQMYSDDAQILNVTGYKSSAKSMFGFTFGGYAPLVNAIKLFPDSPEEIKAKYHGIGEFGEVELRWGGIDIPLAFNVILGFHKATQKVKSVSDNSLYSQARFCDYDTKGWRINIGGGPVGARAGLDLGLCFGNEKWEGDFVDNLHFVYGWMGKFQVFITTWLGIAYEIDMEWYDRTKTIRSVDTKFLSQYAFNSKFGITVCL